MATTARELQLRVIEIEAQRTAQQATANAALRARIAEEAQISKRVKDSTIRSFLYLVRGLHVSRQLKAQHPHLHSNNLSLLSQWVKQHGADKAVTAANMLIKNPDLLEPRSGHSTSSEAAKAVVRSFAETGDARFLDFMARNGLTHRDPSVRVATLQSLGEMGRAARPLLTDIIEAAERDRNPFVRQLAANTHRGITGRRPREVFHR